MASEYPHLITKSPYSFFEFQDDEKRLIEVLENKGIQYGGGHRWSRLYKIWANKSQAVKIEGMTQVTPIETVNLLDLCEMNTIIRAISSIPDNILAAKWKLVAGGSINRYDESRNNSEARNTQFELLLYADLKNSGVNCTLGNPNPDILVLNPEMNINIQCKRILNNTNNSVQRNIHNAVKQLREDFKSNGNLGIVALNIERLFSNGNSFLLSNTQESAIEYLRQLHNNFYDKNKRYWSSKAVLGTTKVPMLLLYTSTMAQLRMDSMKFAHVTEADRMGTIASESSRKQFRKLQSILEEQTHK
jgi:hypothetical protein